MIESKPKPQGQNRLENLRVDEQYLDHPLLKGIPRKDLEDGIGSGVKVISPDDVPYIGLLIDFDLDEVPRFIFAYYNSKTKREHNVDTDSSIGWTVVFDNHSYRL